MGKMTNNNTIEPGGTLYVLGTPIGNLEDLTFRAARILKEVDVVVAEDTRRARKLLSHLATRANLVSFHEHNAVSRLPGILQKLCGGVDVALLSDAGMPCISDPGAMLIQRAREGDLPVVVVPGPSAITSALTWSGLRVEEFVFLGYFPRKTVARRKLLARLQEEQRISVFFESVHRIVKTLGVLAEELPQTEVIVAREMTKVHEEMLMDTPDQIIEQLTRNHSIKGEFTVILDLRKKKAPAKRGAFDKMEN